ncbi:hypothetical protein AAGF08_16140 [Algoriphagus sp. SE2]|uniref:hypothetical protein n=1 Tax=Algoriphagus sp. SE2 TaxID=3141536 RepID=UPI0031CD77D1
MKTKLMFILLLWSIPGFSQVSEKPIGPFIRVYDSLENKIEKGRYLNISEDFEELFLTNNSDTLIVPVAQISYIRTKRSPGHLILVGGAIGFAAGFTMGAISYDPDAWLDFGYGFETIVPGLIVGLGGAALGAVGTGFKKSSLNQIDGSPEKLKEFANSVSPTMNLDE